MSKQLTVARAASERTVGEWQARSESKEAAVLTAKTNEIACLQEQHARCGQLAAVRPQEGCVQSTIQGYSPDKVPAGGRCRRKASHAHVHTKCIMCCFGMHSTSVACTDIGGA